ncbi:hypothetical protein ACV36C_36835 [Pseudomonas aeruginosa]
MLADVPTFREAGVDLAADGWNAFFASSAMAPAKAVRLGEDIAAVMREPAMQEAVRDSYLEPVAADAAASGRDLDAYRAQWEPVVKASGFTATQ